MLSSMTRRRRHPGLPVPCPCPQLSSHLLSLSSAAANLLLQPGPFSPLWAFTRKLLSLPSSHQSKCSPHLRSAASAASPGSLPQTAPTSLLPELLLQDSLAPAQVFSSAPQHVRCSTWFWTPSWSERGRNVLPEHLCSLEHSREAQRTQEQRAGQGHWSLMEWGSRADTGGAVGISRQTWREGRRLGARDQCVKVHSDLMVG